MIVITVISIVYVLIIIDTKRKKSVINKWLDELNEYAQLAVFIFMYIFLTTYLVYLFDFYNFPSNMGLADGVDAGEYVGHAFTLLAAGLSAVVLVVTTKIQIDNSQKQSYERMKEEKRINNMPLLSYIINDNYNSEQNAKICCEMQDKEYVNYDYYNLEITNIGLNAATKIIVDVDDKKCKTGELNQNSLARDKKIDISLVVPKYKTKKLINITVKYQDLIGNNYEQVIHFNIGNQKTLLIINEKGKFRTFKDFKVDDAIYLEPEE